MYRRSKGNARITVALIGAIAGIIAALIQVVGPTILTSPPEPTPMPGSGMSAINSYIELAVQRACLIRTDLLRLPLKQAALHSAQNSGKTEYVIQLRQRVFEIEANIHDGLTDYGNMLAQIAEYPLTSIRQAFASYQSELSRRRAYENVQIRDVVQTHVERYRTKPRFDVNTWERELQRLK